MALKYHPDKAGEKSKLKFQHVGAAYEILKAKPEGKATGSDTDNYAGMSAEDVAWIQKDSTSTRATHGLRRLHFRILLRFGDSNSDEFFYTGSDVSVLWPYKPRATDEFALCRGEMLRILSICDDGWALGYRLGERADGRSGKASNKASNKAIFPAWLNPGSTVKAFPLVCVTVPWTWKKRAEQDSKAKSEGNVSGARPFAPAFKKLKVQDWLKDPA